MEGLASIVKMEAAISKNLAAWEVLRGMSGGDGEGYFVSDDTQLIRNLRNDSEVVTDKLEESLAMLKSAYKKEMKKT